MAGVVRDGAGGNLDVARHKAVKRRPSSDVVPNTVVRS
jgi:molecular chaperone GrpE (heat shock protein)